MNDEGLDFEAIMGRARRISNETERATYVSRTCGGDESLRARIEAALDSEAQATTVAHNIDETLEAPSGARSGSRSQFGKIASESTELAGSVIGHYELLQEIGEGGFGVVYIAQQIEPVRRKVALKIIKLGMDTRQIISRFAAERQTLAIMDHPHIAKVFDAGATETGRPYFVMELVEGIPINKYCDKNKLTLHDRLTLFNKVCGAVQHAHQKGIIHRDLKPSNILVTRHEDRPVPKVIDFGIAKATEQDATAQSMHTEYGQLIGTPAYMSPEQAAVVGQDIDTRSDIYSLGVVLYELLTGTMPFAPETLNQVPVDEIRKMIREHEPSRPSTRLGTVRKDRETAAKRQGVEPKKLVSSLRGDLDWIVMKALEKDRARRYESANGLAMDITRYLEGEPVLAAPPSKIYRMRKIVRRNKGVVTAGLAIAASLLVGIIGFATQAQIANEQRRLADQQRDRAQIEAAKAEKTTSFLTSIFGGISPYKAQGMDTTLLESLLGSMEDRISKELSGQPEVEAAIRETLARAYTSLGKYDKANDQLKQAIPLFEEAQGSDGRETLSAYASQVDLLERWGRHGEAETLAHTTLDAMRRALGKDDAKTLSMMRRLGSLKFRIGKYRESETILRRALAGQTRLLGRDDFQTLLSMNSLAQLLFMRERFAEAEALSSHVIKSRKAALGPDHAQVYEAMDIMASILKGQKRYEEAEQTAREALAGLRRTHGMDNPQTLNVSNNLAYALQQMGRNEEAEALYKETLERRERTLGADHVETLFSVANLGAFYQMTGRSEEALPLVQRALEGRRLALGDSHRDTLGSMLRLAMLLQERRDFEGAAHLLGQIAAVERERRNESDPGFLISLYNWAAATQNTGNHAAAEPIFREVLDLTGKYEQGDKPWLAACLNGYAKCLNVREDLQAADEYFRKALAMRRRLYSKPNRNLCYSLTEYGEFLCKHRRFEEAEPLLRESIAVHEASGFGHVWQVGTTMSLLGESLAAQSQFVEAETTLLEAFERITNAKVALRAQAEGARNRIVDLYKAWEAADPGNGYSAKAELWRAKKTDLVTESSNDSGP